MRPRAYHEVIIHRKAHSDLDTAAEAKYRAEIVEIVRHLEAQGGTPEPVMEFP
jgi:hypothetical protein